MLSNINWTSSLSLFISNYTSLNFNLILTLQWLTDRCRGWHLLYNRGFPSQVFFKYRQYYTTVTGCCVRSTCTSTQGSVTNSFQAMTIIVNGFTWLSAIIGVCYIIVNINGHLYVFFQSFLTQNLYTIQLK